jgi:hypothetical protein
MQYADRRMYKKENIKLNRLLGRKKTKQSTTK